MAVVADVDSDSRILGFEDGISQVAGSEVKLFPESGMAVRNVMLAIFPQISSVGIDHRGSVEVNARHLLFINGDDNHHAMLRSNLLHEPDSRPIGHALGQFVPASILLGAKVRAVEKLLQAEDLGLLLGGLLDQLDVLIDHRFSDLSQGAIGAESVAGLNQGTTDNPRHGSSEEGTIAEFEDC